LLLDGEKLVSPFYDLAEMDDAQVSWVDRRLGYENSLEAEGPDVGHVFGAPNSYEARTRFFGGQSDLLHNLEYGNSLDGKVLILPEDIQNSMPDEEVEFLENEGVVVQTPDRELYTTADDWKSARDIASRGDRIHGYTSDYHGWKTHATGRLALDTLGNNRIHTFAFSTDREERENILKHNLLAQSADTPRQLYKMAKSEDY
jgi:hypothetical protein